jgi:phage terminase large subunit GpA-like protein
MLSTNLPTREAITHRGSNLQRLLRETFEYFRPPPDLTISEWAILNRSLPKGTTSRPGPFRPEVFQIEMMDVILNPNVHEVVIMKSTQIGYSDAVLNSIVGYHIDCDPKPVMLIQPTVDNAKDYGKKRITPMIDSTPCLRAKIRAATSRRAGNTLSLKEYPGGFLKLTGANSGAGLRSDPVPVILYDEVDAYPIEIPGEGDPQAIAARRSDAFTDWKHIKGGTPAKPKGVSPIERDFLKSDQRYFHVPCPFCHKMQPLVWRDPESKKYRLTYEIRDGKVVPESVAYICAGCEGRIPERYKRQMLNAGTWIPRFPGRAVVGFHINALYSNWRENWSAMAEEWYEATAVERNPEKLRAFINLRLGETFEEDSEAVEHSALRERCETYKADVPAGVGILTASVDVQGDRLECVVKGWGDREESWLIAYQQFFGDPGQEAVWDELDEFLLTAFTHVSGAKASVRATMIDSGGLHSDSVYRFVKGRQVRRVWALKGSSEQGKEILGKFSLNNAYKVKLWMIGTDTAKDRIFARMKIPAPGPGFMHLPDWIDEEYLQQLTAEKAVRRYRKGRGAIREYIKTRSRNEALDLEVYALAALYSLGAQTLRELKARADLLTAGTAELIEPAAVRHVRNPGIT